MTTPEGLVQKYCMEQLKKRGCLVRKISYEGRRGCPDLLVLAPERDTEDDYFWPEVLFIEIKKDEQTKPDPHQQREHERMRAVGADVRTVGSKAKVDALITELFPQE